ncbi:hypothetical protein GCM10023189_41980 [Nibrella saemangeumensis]|uniref:Uncharacterized protein n=1 Tax=Nibrella saemangeumensis TaxID=1084526 RepID=A0ABP8NBK2_9BACT
MFPLVPVGAKTGFSLVVKEAGAEVVDAEVVCAEAPLYNNIGESKSKKGILAIQANDWYAKSVSFATLKSAV